MEESARKEQKKEQPPYVSNLMTLSRIAIKFGKTIRPSGLVDLLGNTPLANRDAKYIETSEDLTEGFDVEVMLSENFQPNPLIALTKWTVLKDWIGHEQGVKLANDVSLVIDPVWRTKIYISDTNRHPQAKEFETPPPKSEEGNKPQYKRVKAQHHPFRNKEEESLEIIAYSSGIGPKTMQFLNEFTQKALNRFLIQLSLPSGELPEEDKWST